MNWKPVPEYENYQVSDTGEVLGPRGKVMKQMTDRYGYLKLTICKGKIRWQAVVHQLVLMTFVGPRPSKMHVGDHINGIKSDNRLANLQWITYAENTRKGNGAILTEAQARHILQSTKTVTELAAEMGCTRSNVSLIRHGKNWRDL